MVQDKVFGAQSLKVGVWFRVQGSGFRVQDSGFRIQGAGFRVYDSESRI